jgi:hypothetical protein
VARVWVLAGFPEPVFRPVYSVLASIAALAALAQAARSAWLPVLLPAWPLAGLRDDSLLDALLASLPAEPPASPLAVLPDAPLVWLLAVLPVSLLGEPQPPDALHD